MQRVGITIKTDSSGNGVGYIDAIGPGADCGYIQLVKYIKNSYNNGVSVVITGETSGLRILTLKNMNSSIEKYPRGHACKRNGNKAEYTDGFPIESPIPIIGERIKIVISSGGSNKIGLFYIWVG